MKIFVLERASGDSSETFSYLASRNETAADNFIRAIDEKLAHLARFPFIGRERNSLSPELRSVLVGTHLIFYIVEPERVSILRVIDGRVDVDEEFQR
jgi:toxin ParE1/3/4